MVGHGRERVVIVVPALAKREEAEQPEVTTLVPDVEGTITEQVTNRVDRPWDMVDQHDADKPTPEKPFPTRNEVRNGQSQRHP